MIFLKLICKKLLLIFIISILVIPTMASDNGNKGKKSKIEKKDQIEKNTTEDIGTQVQLKYNENISYTSSYDESVESMASWHISQSIPKPEKVSKKEEQQEEKFSRKIIRKEKKECKKLQRSFKKNKHKANYNK